MAFEKPQKGNPHKLTVKQHVFPRRSIERFYDSGNGIELSLAEQKMSIRALSTHDVFCAKRAWSHRVESGFMTDIERRYQEVAEAIVEGRVSSITALDQRAVSDMFALWRVRWHWQDSDHPDPKLKMDRLERALPIDVQERMEKVGVLFTRPDGTFPLRQAVGVNIQLDQEELAHAMSGRAWGIVRAASGQFVVPDTYGSDAVLPLSPTIVLAWDCPDKTITGEAVAAINRVAFARHKRYLFAESFARALL
jgi:hypothetical protein